MPQVTMKARVHAVNTFSPTELNKDTGLEEVTGDFHSLVVYEHGQTEFHDLSKLKVKADRLASARALVDTDAELILDLFVNSKTGKATYHFVSGKPLSKAA